MQSFLTRFWLVISLLLIMVWAGCRGPVPRDEPHQLGEDITDFVPNQETAEQLFPPTKYRGDTPAGYNFHYVDCEVVDGNVSPRELDDIEVVGRNAWLFWTGGNERFWDWLSRNGYGTMDFLKVLKLSRSERLKRAGLINEPGMEEPSQDFINKHFGVVFDQPKNQDYYDEYGPDPKVYGYPTGVVGMRIFENPEFKNNPTAQRIWERNRKTIYDEDNDFLSRPNTVKPYLVGISCAICHASFHPLNPPDDEVEPEWENISTTIGAQFMRVREVFGNNLRPDNYLYHVMDSQLPGTIDTSLIASDQINNANTMNAIFGLQDRVSRALFNPPEVLSSASYGPPNNPTPGLWDPKIAYDEQRKYYYPPSFEEYREEFESQRRHVPRVLVDGSDSVGTWLALARVYLNIGTYHQQWIRTHNTILGFKKQDPFLLADCEENSLYWHATKIRVDPMTKYFIKVSNPMKLKDAKVKVEGSEIRVASAKDFFESSKLTGADQNERIGTPMDPTLSQGRQVFARGCIACHSSKQPSYYVAERNRREKNQKGSGDQFLKDLNIHHLDLSDLTLEMSDLQRLTHGDGELPERYQAWANNIVQREEFWQDNFLSTDMRIPVTITETNSARSMATNAKHDHMWEDFASNTFKDLPSVGKIHYRDPFSDATNSYDSPAGGPGYYRVPTLISAWATAPFFHNNSLGDFNGKSSVQGRLECYDDAIEKLLWPERRLQNEHDLGKLEGDVASVSQIQDDGGLVWRTSQRTYLKIPGHQVPSFLAGFTGLKPIWLRVLPWLPALLALVFGLYFLFKSYGMRQTSVIEKYPWFAYPLRFIAAIGFFLLGVALIYVIIRFFGTFRLVEVSSGWIFPWILIQLGVLTILVWALTVYVAFRLRSIARYLAATFVVGSVLFAFGIGGFASGMGGDLQVGPFPKGLPVSLLSNMSRDASVKDLSSAAFALIEHIKEYSGEGADQADALAHFEEFVAPKLMDVSNCPDLILDRGHDYRFIQNLTDHEKEQLAELIKTF